MEATGLQNLHSIPDKTMRGRKTWKTVKNIDISSGEELHFWNDTYSVEANWALSSYKKAQKHGVLAMSAFCGHKIGFICTRYKNVNIAK